jgi:hypothetical protein
MLDFSVVIRTCTVKEIGDIEHSVGPPRLSYEAIATAIATLQQDSWVGEIGQGVHQGNCSCPSSHPKA